MNLAWRAFHAGCMILILFHIRLLEGLTIYFARKFQDKDYVSNYSFMSLILFPMVMIIYELDSRWFTGCSVQSNQERILNCQYAP